MENPIQNRASMNNDEGMKSTPKLARNTENPSSKNGTIFDGFKGYYDQWIL